MMLTIDVMGKEKVVSTKYGPKKKFSIKSGETWYSVWNADWNEGWQKGDQVDVVVKSREWNGNTYWDIKGPASDAGGSPSRASTPQPQGQLSPDQVEGLQVTLARLEGKIDQLLQEQARSDVVPF